MVDSLHKYLKFVSFLSSNSYKSEEKSENSEVKKIRYRINYIYRGISSKKHIFPTIMRDGAIKDQEFEYVRKFEQNCVYKLGWFNTCMDLVATGQHYSLRTRLIDWSSSILIATLFSLMCDTNKPKNDCKDIFGDYTAVMYTNKYESVWLFTLKESKEYYLPLYMRYVLTIKEFEKILESKNTMDRKERLTIVNMPNHELIEKIEKGELNDKAMIIHDYIKNIFESTNTLYMLNNSGMDKYNHLKSFRNCLRDNTKFFIECNCSNERIHNQRGLFEIADLNCDFESKNNLGNVNLLLIHKRARKEIMKFINTMGINYYTLMDDPQNFAYTVNNTINKYISFDKKIEYDN